MTTEETKVILAYRILLIMTAIDGYTKEKGRAAVKYLKKKEEQGWVEDLIEIYESENPKLLALEGDEIPGAFKSYVMEFGSISSEEDNVELIHAMYDIMEADGRITQKEYKIFLSTAAYFNIDVKPMFEKINI